MMLMHHAEPDHRQRLGELAMAKSRIIMDIGKRYGRLIVLGPSDVPECWLFRCDCGTERAVRKYQVIKGGIVSCGCRNREILAANWGKRKTHGMRDAPEYACWHGMRARCLEPEGGQNYPHYGAHGITVCERWISSFENFYADMGPRPSPDHSIDRIDSSQGYFPANCRWATDYEQCRNRRSNINVEYDGQTMCMKDAAKAAGIRYETVLGRIKRHAWSVEQALAIPARKWSRR